MIDPTPNEIAAMRHAGQLAGEYLDSIARTDLATLTTEEWHIFVDCVVTGYCEHLADLIARDAKHRAAITEGMPF
ncbi:MAG: DUF6511 domain-containing protein [Hyphomicrobiales bacterium]